jgi:hypothetical protein
MLIKIIWDFRGENAEAIAKHHAIHLKEFCDKHKVECHEIDIEKKNEMYSIAYIITEKPNVMVIRDALKPHRAEVFQV